MSNWNDDRLDKRDQDMKEGFNRVEGQITKVEGQVARVEGQITKVEGQVVRLEDKMNKGFGELRQEISQTQMMVLAVNRTLLTGAIAIVVALLGIVGALLA